MSTKTASSVSTAVEFLRKVSPEVPATAVVLGSGVNVLENLEDQKSYSYDEVFGMSPSVAGHAGSLSLGRVKDRLVAVLRGRFHFYEGHEWGVVTLPARALVEWGVPNLILTNAAGGLNRNYHVGDLMLLSGYRDHINPRWQEEGLLPALALPATSCENDLSKRLWETSEKLVKEDKSYRALQKGVYAGLLGPNYESLAEIEMLRRLKADAVGMSTVPEMLTAIGSKTEAAAISVVTNVWREDTEIDGHEEVLKAAKEASTRLDKLLRAAITA